MVTKNVAAKVLLKSEKDDGWYVEFAAEGISQWTKVYKIPHGDAQRMTEGQTIVVALRQGTLLEDKHGVPRDPNKPWSYRWEWVGFSNQEIADTPASHEDEPHPADAAERSEAGVPEAPQPQGSTQGQEEAEQGVVVRSYRYGHTYNLGNYESERFEMESEAVPGLDDLAMFTLLKERIDAVRTQLPVDTSARKVAREQQEN